MNNDPFKPTDLYHPDKPDIVPAASFDSDDSVLNEMADILKSVSDKLDEVEQSQSAMQDQVSAIREENQSTESQNLRLTYFLIGIGILTLLATIVGLYV